MLLASYLVVRPKLIMSALIWNGRLIKFTIQTVRDSIFRKILLYKQMALSYVDQVSIRDLVFSVITYNSLKSWSAYSKLFSPQKDSSFHPTQQMSTHSYYLHTSSRRSAIQRTSATIINIWSNPSLKHQYEWIILNQNKVPCTYVILGAWNPSV